MLRGHERGQEWTRRARAMVRELGSSSEHADRARQSWAWLSRADVGPLLPGAVKVDLVLTALLRTGVAAAVEVFCAIGCPTALADGRPFLHLLSSNLARRDNVEAQRRLGGWITAVTGHPSARSQMGPPHVEYRLAARGLGMNAVALAVATAAVAGGAGGPDGRPPELADMLWSIEQRQAGVLFRTLQHVDDCADLVALGWRPQLATLIEHAHQEPVGALVPLIAPVLWQSLVSTAVPLRDSPYEAPSRLPTEPLESLQFWDQTSEHWLTSYRELIRDCPHAPDPRPPNGIAAQQPLTSPQLQRLLALVHKGPALMRLAWAAKAMSWPAYVSLFEREHWHAMLQILLQAPAEMAPCRCHLERLRGLDAYRTNTARGGHRAAAARRRHGGEEGAARHKHSCDPERRTILVNSLQQMCLPWLRAIATSADAINDASPTLAIAAPFGLNFVGRAVAIAHFLVELYWRGVTATSAQIIGDIVAHWERQPSIKDLRAFFSLASELSRPQAPSASAQSNSPAATAGSKSPTATPRTQSPPASTRAQSAPVPGSASPRAQSVGASSRCPVRGGDPLPGPQGYAAPSGPAQADVGGTGVRVGSGERVGAGGRHLALAGKGEVWIATHLQTLHGELVRRAGAPLDRRSLTEPSDFPRDLLVLDHLYRAIAHVCC